MKKLLILFLAIISSAGVAAQVTNTSWKGIFNIPDPTEMILQFKADTLLLNYPSGSTLEEMSYKINNDTLSIQKLEGQSDCNTSEDAIYKIVMKNKRLFISPLSDNCFSRLNAWSSKGLEKIEPGNL